MNILCNLDRGDFRRWQAELIGRLRGAGHGVGIAYGESLGAASEGLDFILRAEARRFGAGLAGRLEPPGELAVDAPRLIVNFAGPAGRQLPVLTLSFDGARTVAGAALGSVGSPAVPHLVAWLDGAAVAEAFPMVGDRAWLSRGLDDLLGRAITLLLKCVDDFAAGRLVPIEVAPDPTPAGRNLVGSYLPRLAGHLAGRALGKVFDRPFYWRTGYRLVDGPGVAQTGNLGGAPWTVLGDDRKRFYADPFPFEWQGRHFLFVEEFPYDVGRGQVAVSEIGADGKASPPQTVLAEPFHLSYPQVFARDGAVWMLPETSAQEQLILYRAERMPERWARHRVLLEGVEISDATLLEHGGRLWLFGAGRDGRGSPSDTLVVYSAERLEGPWQPHRRNPILIDARRARPGGAFVWRDGKLLLPVQDGSLRYGGGLGLSELLEVGDSDVRLGMPVPVPGIAGWPGIHTLNRAGRLEAIDSAATLRK